MNKSQRALLIFAVAMIALGCNRSAPPAVASSPTTTAEPASADAPSDDINVPPDEVPQVGTQLELTEDQWRDRLTAEQFRILRQQGTERPGSGAYNDFKGAGTYHCSGCNAPLFASDTKFDSRTGWPSFYEPIADGRVGERADDSHGMSRVEVVCEHCGGHLGHVFNDGPPPTGQRYCINSVSLYFRPD